ncbi:hypothetical protein A0H76_2830 [Hepatospora eriocheir]|uniref:Kinetochore protein Spc24 n=1 Tax=Hepatospora eriocheir TaxID=1081669 RepID=A0A1X0QLC5_9MICR|nr:hypothetical protein A0H76_2830 [Hepatospora eriocheir]
MIQEDNRKVIKNITKKWDTSHLIDLLDKLKFKIDNNKHQHVRSIESIKEEENKQQRRIEQLKSEIEILSTQFENLRSKCKKKQNEKYSLFKFITETEQQIDETNERIQVLENEKKEFDDKISKAIHPTYDAFYLALMKCTGIDFYEENQNEFVRIKNVKRNDIFTFNLDEMELSEAINTIWDHIE